MDVQCAGIKANGERCNRSADSSAGFCWGHDPKNAERRRRQASKAGRSKPSREIRTLKAELKTLKDDVLAGTTDRNDAAVAVQIYRTLKDLVELERRLREQDEIIERLEQLEQLQQTTNGGRRAWGR